MAYEEESQGEDTELLNIQEGQEVPLAGSLSTERDTRLKKWLAKKIKRN